MRLRDNMQQFAARAREILKSNANRQPVRNYYNSQNKITNLDEARKSGNSSKLPATSAGRHRRNPAIICGRHRASSVPVERHLWRSTNRMEGGKSRGGGMSLSYLLDEGKQGSLDGARFNLWKVEIRQAGGRHGWRGRDCACARARGSPAAIGHSRPITWRRLPTLHHSYTLDCVISFNTYSCGLYKIKFYVLYFVLISDANLFNVSFASIRRQVHSNFLIYIRC